MPIQLFAIFYLCSYLFLTKLHLSLLNCIVFILEHFSKNSFGIIESLSIMKSNQAFHLEKQQKGHFLPHPIDLPMKDNTSLN